MHNTELAPSTLKFQLLPKNCCSIVNELLKRSFCGQFCLLWIQVRILHGLAEILGLRVKIRIGERQLICGFCIFDCAVFCDSFRCRWRFTVLPKLEFFRRSAILLNMIGTGRNDALRRPRLDPGWNAENKAVSRGSRVGKRIPLSSRVLQGPNPFEKQRFWSIVPQKIMGKKVAQFQQMEH